MKKTPITILGGGVLYEPEIPGVYLPMAWLHGLNGRYNSDGVGRQLENGLEVPYRVFCFQNPSADWSKNETIACRNYIREHTPLKVNVIGVSQGGQGTAAWLNFCREDVNTAGIICGWTQMSNYSDFVGISIKAWHGSADSVVNPGPIKKFIAGCKAAGVDAELQIYEGDGHNIVGKATSLTDPLAYWSWLKSKLTEEPQPEPKDPVTETYYQDGKLNFVTISGKTYTVIPEN